MADPHIATAIERGITSQSELITTLSLAVIGGLLALLVQFRMHNAAKPQNPVEMRAYPVFCLALVCAGIAIALGYVLSGMLVQMAPQIFNHAFDASKKFSEQNFDPAPAGQIQLFSLLQFLVFVGAVFAGTVFVLKNRN